MKKYFNTINEEDWGFFVEIDTYGLHNFENNNKIIKPQPKPYIKKEVLTDEQFFEGLNYEEFQSDYEDSDYEDGDYEDDYEKNMKNSKSEKKMNTNNIIKYFVTFATPTILTVSISYLVFCVL
jgi:hypothetical protein